MREFCLYISSLTNERSRNILSPHNPRRMFEERSEFLWYNRGQLNPAHANQSTGNLMQTF